MDLFKKSGILKIAIESIPKNPKYFGYLTTCIKQIIFIAVTLQFKCNNTYFTICLTALAIK